MDIMFWVGLGRHFVLSSFEIDLRNVHSISWRPNTTANKQGRWYRWIIYIYIDCDVSVMLTCLMGYCMAKSGFDHTITQPPKLFQLRKLEIQQSLRIEATWGNCLLDFTGGDSPHQLFVVQCRIIRMFQRSHHTSSANCCSWALPRSTLC